MHEAACHEHNSFITLTYSPDHLPRDGELVPRHLTLFFHRLRKALRQGDDRLLGHRLRYLACGEYGDHTLRPHYHAILFGVGFNDLKLCGKDLYESAALDELWRLGMCKVGAVTAASASYVAQYTVKKIGRVHCDVDGVVKEAPFLRCSLKPGIGAKWLDQYGTDVRHGYVVNDRPTRMPRYYRTYVERTQPKLSSELEGRREQYRKEKFAKIQKDRRERLAAAEVIHERRMQLTRERKL